MQSYSINSQKRKLQVIIVAFIIITMLSQWFTPLIVHAEEERELEFNTSLTLFKDGETTPFRKTVKVKGQGHFVATSFQYIADTSYSFRMFIVSEKPFYRTLHSVSAYGQTTTNTDIGQATYYGGVYYLSVADYGGTCAIDTQIQSNGLVNVTDCSDSNFFDILKERIDNNYYDLSKDDYKEISYNTDTRHDFGSDIVDTSIPTPELTNITHNGFIVSNMGDYYIDVYTESFLYGVSMKKITSRWLPEVDTSWVYSSHKYNFVDLSDVAVSSSNVNIKTLWNVDNELNLVNDFKKWSSEFPDINSLPSYSFTKGSSAGSTQYNLNYNYNKVIGNSDREKLRTSAQACTVFYVRFYTKDIKCGQWMKYTYRDGAKNAGASVIVEQVSFSKTGEETIIDKAEGRQDYDTGITDFDSSNDLSFDLTDVDSFFNYLTSIFDSCKNSVSAFASLIYACVPFLPSELINVIVLAIVIMLFIGIIKAVVS